MKYLNNLIDMFRSFQPTPSPDREQGMQRVGIELKYSEGSWGELPEYKHEGDSGADVRCNEGFVLKPGETRTVKTGLKLAFMPIGFEIQVRTRSGLATKGIVVANSPGTIDSGYRGDLNVIIYNQSGEAFSVEKGDRIAQFVVAPVYKGVFSIVDDHPAPPKPPVATDSISQDESTGRGEGGFGSTGVR